MANRFEYDVSLQVIADTQKAKQQLKDLQNSLNNLINNQTSSGMPLTKDITKATEAATKLQSALLGATNASTGKLDLTKFNESLKKSNLTAESLKNSLMEFGAQGDKIFLDLSKQIIQAEVPLTRISNSLKNFGKGLVRSAVWQAQTSLIHSMVGALQGAYSYAQDLNQSLNNIRIVTGQNIDQMAEFARQANEAAKALSTSTTTYTNASLVYYQQGLDTKEVKERTDVTIKMANVARESSEEISQQMTAVWNNFADGSKSLEYYADVMTALGATTASSTKEISEGIQKFASVTQTIGLSYEYSAAALATITATTRESADVVGNALKTLFSRIQGLKLGETLDDGTDLNKYSKALNSVGISIKDQNGELKNMDTILDEMGAKWKDLSKDQQLGLAQTVAGVRQYAQLVALMDNWDFFQKNVETAYNSTGTLSEQADIYAESWEAASMRVKASTQSIYQSILNDNFFIKMNNGLASTLDFISKIIDGMGGVKSILLVVSSIATNLFQKEIANGLSNFGFTVKGLLGVNKAESEKTKQTYADLAKSMGLNSTTNEGSALYQSYDQQIRLQSDLEKSIEKLDESEKSIYQSLLEQHKIRSELAVDAAKQLDIAQETAQDEEINLSVYAYDYADRRKKNSLSKEEYDKIRENELKSLTNQEYENLVKGRNLREGGKADNRFKDKAKIEASKKIDSRMSELGLNYFDPEQWIKEYENKMQTTGNQMQQNGVIEDLITKIRNKSTEDAKAIINQTLEGLNNNSFKLDENHTNLIKDLQQGIDSGSQENFNKVVNTVNRININDQNIAQQQLIDTFVEMGRSEEDAIAIVNKFSSTQQNVGRNLSNTSQKLQEQSEQADKLGKSLEGVRERNLSFTQSLAGGLSVMSSMMMSMQGISNLCSQVASGTADVTTAVMSLGMFLPGVISAINQAKALGSPFGWIGLAVGAIPVLIQLFDYLYTSEEEAYEKLVENNKKLKDELQEVTAKNEQLKQSFDNYQSIIDSLNGCVKGTQDWKDRLKEVYDKTKEIIETYPELLRVANLFTTNENGERVINEEVLQNYLDQQEQKENALEMASYNSDLEVSNKKSNDFFTEDNINRLFLQKLEIEIEGENGEKSILTEYQKLADDSQYSEIVTTLNENLDKINFDSLESFGNSIQKILGDKVNTSRYLLNGHELTGIESLYNLSREYASNTNDIDSYKYKIASKNGIDNVADQELFYKYYTSEYGTKFNKVQDFTNADKLEQLQKLGYNDVTIKGNDFIDSNGQKIENIDTIIASYLAQLEVDTIKDKIQNARNNSGLSNKVYDAYITGDLSKLSQQELDDLAKSEKVNRDQKNQEILKNIEEQKSVINNFSKNDIYSDIVNESDLASIIKNQSLPVQEAIYDTMQSVAVIAGKDGLGVLNNTFKNLGNNTDSFRELTKEAQKEDITVEELTKTAEKLGYISNDTAGDMERLIESLQGIGAANNFESFAESYSEIDGVIKKIKDDTNLTGKEYEILQGKYSEYFITMADNTHKLLIEAEKFKEIVSGDLTQELKDNREKFIIEASNYQNAVNSYVQYANGNKSYVSTTTDLLPLLNLLKPSSINEKDLVDWNNNPNDYIQEIREAWNNYAADFTPEILSNQIKEKYDDIVSNAFKYDTALAYTAEDISSLKDLQNNGFITDEAYNNRALDLALQSKDLEELQKNRDQYGEDIYSQAALKLNDKFDLAGIKEEDLKQFTEDVQKAAKENDKFVEGLEDNDEVARIVAKSMIKMDRGLSSICKNFDSWNKVLTESDKNSKEYVDTLTSLRTSVADLYDLDDAYISNDFVTEHLEQIEKISNGDKQAIKDLKIELQNDVLKNILNTDTLNEEATSFLDKIRERLNKDDIKIGTTIGAPEDEEFIKSLNHFVESTKMSVDQMNALFDTLGFEVEIATMRKVVQSKVPRTATITSAPETLPDGSTKTVSYTRPDGYETLTSIMDVPAVNANGTPVIKDVVVKSQAENTTAITTGGSGSKSSPAVNKKASEYTKETQFYSRYKEITDDLDDVAIALDKISKAEEDAFGSQKLRQMENFNKETKKQLGMEQEKLKQAREYLKTDRKVLEDAAKNIGYSKDQLDFDKNGNLNNYEEIARAKWAELHELELYAGNAANFADKEAQDKWVEDNLQPLQDAFNEFKEAQSQYDDTLKVIEDQQEAIRKAVREIQSKNFEIINYKLELRTQINERDLKALDFEYKKLGDDILNAFEAYGLLYNKDSQDKMDITINKLKDQEAYYEELRRNYNPATNSNINQADFIEGSQKAYDAIYDNLNALIDLDKETREYYTNTLQKANDRINEFVTGNQNIADVLNTMNNVFGLLNKTLDAGHYAGIDNILRAQKKVQENTLQMQKERKRMHEDQLEELKKNQADIQDVDSDAYRELQKKIDALNQMILEDEKDVLDSIQSIADSAYAIYDNLVKQERELLDRNLSGGLGFDELQSRFGLSQSLADKQLTATNKIYELNKLQSTLTKDMDKISNKAAKQQLANFGNEIGALKEKDTLSQVELDIEKAKYEVLKARIALEEAQQAKSMVRLTRDNEGNFGYVYTADTDKVGAAKDELDARENDLYNLRLNNINTINNELIQTTRDYQQKYQEIQDREYADENQRQEDLTNLTRQYNAIRLRLQEDLLISSVENESNMMIEMANMWARNEITAEEYSDFLKKNVQSIEDAETASAKAVKDAWTNSEGYKGVMDYVVTWEPAMKGYIGNVNGYHDELDATVKGLAKDSKLSYEAIANSSNKWKDASEELKTTLLGSDGKSGVFGEIEKELKDVQATYLNYVNTMLKDKENGLQAQINKWQELANKIQAVIDKQSELNGAGKTAAPTPTPYDTTHENSNSGQANGTTGGSGSGSAGSASSSTPHVNDKISYAPGATVWSYYGDGKKYLAIDKSLNTKVSAIETGSDGKTLYVITNTGSRIKASDATYSSFATGGYTGEWGPSGKLAMLHQKEMVLNADDTKNMLQAVQLLRAVTSTIDMQAAYMSTMGMVAPSVGGVTNEMQQNVTITAEFPNAINRDEISAAFDTLINRASQYANRK